MKVNTGDIMQCQTCSTHLHETLALMSLHLTPEECAVFALFSNDDMLNMPRINVGILSIIHY